MDRTVAFRIDDETYEAIVALAGTGVYASPSHAFRRALALLLATHGVVINRETDDEAAA